MLVLSRRQSERIRLGDSIVVTVIRVAGDKVRLGIEAPPSMVVLRDELQPRHARPAGATVVAAVERCRAGTVESSRTANPPDFRANRGFQESRRGRTSQATALVFSETDDSRLVSRWSEFSSDPS